MLLAVGMVIVFVSCIGGFVTAGGNPISLIHPGEIMIICGIGLGHPRSLQSEECSHELKV